MATSCTSASTSGTARRHSSLGTPRIPSGTTRPQLTLLLPDHKLSFSCCSSGSNSTGTYLRLTPAVFDPVVVGPGSLSGTIHYSASNGGTPYASVAQSASIALDFVRVHDHVRDHEHQRRTDDAPTGGDAQLLRLVRRARPVSTSRSGRQPRRPARSRCTARQRAATSRRRLRARQAHQRSPPTPPEPGSEWAACVYPLGGLDNTLHPTEFSAIYSGYTMAVEWTDHNASPLAAGGTAYYSLDIALEQTRELQLSLHDPANTLVGNVTEFRSTPKRSMIVAPRACRFAGCSRAAVPAADRRRSTARAMRRSSCRHSEDALS